MARQKDIDKWYENFKKQMDARGMDIEQESDALRIRIPSADKKSSIPLFPEGFVDTPENREKLYDKAKNGEAFFFDKMTQDAYQLGSNSDKDCLVDRANAIGMMPEEPGVFYNLANLLTLGLVEALYGHQKEYEKRMSQFRESNHIPSVGGFTRLLNKITFGLVAHDKCLDYDRAMERIELCHDMERVFRSEEGVWKRRAETEEQERKQQKKNQKKEERINGIKEQINNMDNPETNPLEEAGLLGNPEVKSHMFKSQLSKEYEAMKDAFRVGGKGWEEASKHVNAIEKIVEIIKNNPALQAATGLTPKKCQKFENLSRCMKDVFGRGLNAKATLLEHEAAGGLTPEEREQAIKDIQVMNILQNTLINSAAAKDQPWREGNVVKTSRLINQMRKDPETFRETMENMVNQLDSTQNMKNMTKEQLSEYVGRTEQMMEQIKVDMNQINMRNQAVGPNEPVVQQGVREQNIIPPQIIEPQLINGV